jgi:hypothetical protein
VIHARAHTRSVFLGEQAAEAEPAAVVVALLDGGAGGGLGARDGAAGGQRLVVVDLVEERVRLQELVLLEDEAGDEVAEALLLIGRRLPAPRGGRRGEHGPPRRPRPARRRRHGGAAEPHRSHAAS